MNKVRDGSRLCSSMIRWKMLGFGLREAELSRQRIVHQIGKIGLLKQGRQILELSSITLGEDRFDSDSVNLISVRE